VAKNQPAKKQAKAPKLKRIYEITVPVPKHATEAQLRKNLQNALSLVPTKVLVNREPVLIAPVWENGFDDKAKARDYKPV
jgi:hypothetical protein